MLKTKNIKLILNEIKSKPYKWWKKDKPCKSVVYEQIYDYGTFRDSRIAELATNDLYSRDIGSKLAVIDNLNTYKVKSSFKYNHLLAINEEILEYVQDRLVGKDGRDELVDILIFSTLYLKLYYDYIYVEFMNAYSSQNMLPKRVGFNFKWLKSGDNLMFNLTQLITYCLEYVTLQDLVNKISYNNYREDHVGNYNV